MIHRSQLVSRTSPFSHLVSNPRENCDVFRLKCAPAVLALAVATALVPSIAAAQTEGGSGEQSLQNQVAEESAAELQAIASVHAAEQQAAELTDRAGELTTELDAAQAALDPLQARVDELTAQEQAAEQALADAKARLDASAGSILITESQTCLQLEAEVLERADLVRRSAGAAASTES